jgi:predicted RNase H-like nuclease (RuvC/YqgF family)
MSSIHMITKGRKGNEMEESRYIGVDPGQSGGVSVLDISGEIVDVVAFKKMTLHDIAEWFREWRNDRT